MNIWEAVDELEPDEVTVYEEQPYGPVRIRDRDGATVAEGPACVVSIPVPLLAGRSEVQGMARAGIPVAVDGRPVAGLFQPGHGFLQRSRVLHLEGPEWVPEGAVFRAKGLSGRVVLEGPGCRLVDTPRPVLRHGHRRLVLADGVATELVTVFALVQVALAAAVEL